jgi:hypothetical protein
MARVRAAAAAYRCETMPSTGAMSYYSVRTLQQLYAMRFNANVAWIRAKMAQRYVIIDIGPDFPLRATGRRCASSFYLMEFRLTLTYPGTVHTWNLARGVFSYARCYD